MSGSLLIVDDDPGSRRLLRGYLTPHGFEVSDVGSGEEALALLASRPCDLVLLDIEMPGMSGMEVLRRLRQKHPADLLPVMMATAKDRASDVVGALQAGANDYVTKPFDLPVVLARVQTQCALAHARRQVEQANKRMRLELEAAARVQKTLLPSSTPRLPGVEFAWTYRPCTELAGDLLGCVALPDRRLCLYVLDVVHHGVKAALLAVMVNRVLSHLLAEGPWCPVQMAAELHREFPWDDRTQQFFTLQLGMLDREAGTFAFATAAHPGPIIVRADGRGEALRLPSSPIGLGEGEYELHRLSLGKGDRLYLFSDGVTEAHDVDKRQFGPDRSVAVLRAARAAPLGEGLSRLVAAIEAYTAPLPPHDDISLAAIELT